MRNGEQLLNRYREFLGGDDENVWELDEGGGCRTF